MHSRLLSLVVAGVLAFACSASGADLPEKVNRPAAVVADTWSGFYIGATAGFGLAEDAANYRAIEQGFYAPAINRGEIPTRLNPDARGFIGGITLGYNYQPNSVYVVGFEADISYSDIKGTKTFISIPAGFDPVINTEQTNQLRWFGTTRVRGGILATPSLLAYATGGVAYGGMSIETHTTVSPGLIGAPPFCGPAGNIWCGDGSRSKILFGWTAGGGLEQALPHGWSAKVEYLYYDLGTVSYSHLSQSPAGLLAMNVESAARGHIGRFGVNRRF